MKTDSDEFWKRVEEAKEHEKKIDDLRVAVIKGHLLVEEAMDGLLEVALFSASYVWEERPTFHFKGKLAQALSLKEDKDPLWAVFWAINQLRNKIGAVRNAVGIRCGAFSGNMKVSFQAARSIG
jgi:hypothetical protein